MPQQPFDALAIVRTVLCHHGDEISEIIPSVVGFDLGDLRYERHREFDTSGEFYFCLDPEYIDQMQEEMGRWN